MAKIVCSFHSFFSKTWCVTPTEFTIVHLVTILRATNNYCDKRQLLKNKRFLEVALFSKNNRLNDDVGISLMSLSPADFLSS